MAMDEPTSARLFDYFVHVSDPRRGVSHLLHMAFLPGLYGSLCHLCFVNPAMERPPPPAEPVCSPSSRTSVLSLANICGHVAMVTQSSYPFRSISSGTSVGAKGRGWL